MMMYLRRWSLLLLLCPSSHSFQAPTPQRHRHHSTIQLASDNESTPNKPKGVYVRPSAVIEKGSGFFFPGLEGPRVRLVVGGGLLVATVVNHFYSSSTSVFSEGLGVFYSLLVLLQGAIETSKEGRIETIAARESSASTSASSSKADLSQQWTTTKAGAFQDRVEWAAASYLSLTAATHMILMDEKEGVLYWLGVTPNDQPTASAAEAALATIRQSKGGRVALPNNHPAAQGILPDETSRRCVLLQRINSDMCWMVASNDLLASFTKQDLQWLGQLASYVADDKEQ